MCNNLVQKSTKQGEMRDMGTKVCKTGCIMRTRAEERRVCRIHYERRALLLDGVPVHEGSMDHGKEKADEGVCEPAQVVGI